VRRLALLSALLALGVAACGSTSEPAAEAPPPPPTLRAADLPDLGIARVRSLTVPGLAEDALAPAKLEGILGAAGFLGGSEREFSGHTAIFDHVIARALRFESPAGARAYLAWLRSHPDDLLGASLPARPFTPGADPVAWALDRCDSCKKEVPAFMAAWRRGDVVGFLLAAGPGVDRRAFDSLARRLDARIGA
jgi:hypothetical protein